MSPKIIGKVKNVPNAPEYLKTGFYSLDRAFNPNGENLGLPLGTLHEWYGAEHTGKSTTCYSLASLVAKHFGGGWVLCDVEGAATNEYLLLVGEKQGMDENHPIHIAEGFYHEDKLSNMLTIMKEQEPVVSAGVMDSLGMLASKGELEGELGDANMGKRAFMINQWVRRFTTWKGSFDYIPPQSTIFVINHQQQSLGGYGMNRPGGSGKDYGAGVRVHLKRLKVGSNLTFADGSFYLEGTIKKLRYRGGIGNTFRFVNKVNYGMHKGLSAIMDCKDLKLLKINKGIIKIGDETLGRFSKYLNDLYEDDENFNVFYELLEKVK